MTIRLFNTMGREIQEFHPLAADSVSLYTCGPTVYDFAHIGNLKTYVFEDVLRRTLEYFGFHVRHVMNVTDVGHLSSDADEGDDKMVKSARQKGKTIWEIADFYTKAFFTDVGRLNCLVPEVVCKATDHIAEMIALIEKIEKNGYTYLADGNVYFDISRFPSYGKMALLDRQELKAGARIAVDSGKKNPFDFVLWFTKSKFENQAMLWDSPWGKGYPGWHIECSAMSMKYLGERIDIHCGGIDHIPVHHTNEIAQSEAATGKPWVNYWLHGEFLNMGSVKMAKSAGNFTTLSSLVEKGYNPLDYRYYLLGAHYRSPLQFGQEALDAAKTARRGLVDRILRLKGSVAPAAPIGGKAAEYLKSFQSNAAEDLNMPRCLADLWTLLRDPEVPDDGKLAAALDMDRILGLDLANEKPEEAPKADSEAEALIREREEARKRKDFRRADEIRDILLAKGYRLEDGASGTRIKR